MFTWPKTFKITCRKFLIGEHRSQPQLNFKDKCLLLMHIQEIAASTCPIRCQEFFVLKIVILQIWNSRPRKTLNSYVHERNVTFFKVIPLLYVDRPFFFLKSWTPNLNAKFKILDSENPWVRIIVSVTSLYLKSLRHLGPRILFLKILTSNSKFPDS